MINITQIKHMRTCILVKLNQKNYTWCINFKNQEFAAFVNCFSISCFCLIVILWHFYVVCFRNCFFPSVRHFGNHFFLCLACGQLLDTQDMKKQSWENVGLNSIPLFLLFCLSWILALQSVAIVYRCCKII